MSIISYLKIYFIIRLVRVVEGLRAGESREGHTQRILAIMRSFYLIYSKVILLHLPLGQI